MADTESRMDIAFKLFDEGKRPSDPEVKELGLKPSSTCDYFQQWKRGKGNSSTTTKEDSSTTVPKNGRQIEVGKITVTPENWGVSRYGAILILDTYRRVQTDLKYTGSMDDFLCNTVQTLRRMLDYDKAVV